MSDTDAGTSGPELSEAEQQEAALDVMLDAWRNALAKGVVPETIAAVAIATGFTELVGKLGEQAAIDVAERLPDQIRSGVLTPRGTH
jgi:hypothetical protein